MSRAVIVQKLHQDFGVTISEAIKAYDIAVEYLRLRSVGIGDHPDNYKPSEYILTRQKNGKWKFVYGDGRTCCDGWKCTACGKEYHTKVPYFNEFNFCPNCGAKMEEQNE